jgi:group I intron endonuclease
MTLGFIYGLQLKTSDQIRYVGQARNIKKRFGQHVLSTRNGSSLPVHNWIRKYGGENIESVVLVSAPISDLNQLEIFWINKLRLEGKDLLNLTDGGGGSRGRMHSLEQRKTWSEQRKGSISGEKNPNWGKFGPKHHAYGKRLSEETKKKLSDSKKGEKNHNYGKTLSDETKKKMSLVRKGRPQPTSAKSAHTRWHVNKNRVNDQCKWCIGVTNENN